MFRRYSVTFAVTSILLDVILVARALSYTGVEIIKLQMRWMQYIDLVWLGRLIIEPRCLWRRNLIGNPLFFYRVLRQRFTQDREPSSGRNITSL